MSRYAVLAIVSALLAAGPARAVPAHQEPTVLATYAELLTRYVTPQGVRYAAWRADATDRARLTEVVAGLAAVEPAGLAPADRHALYVNLYNAKILELVIEGNPRKSIKDLSKGINPYEIFKRKLLPFGGASISLEELEARLRKESADPRVHFAVNCASRSCPPILAEPYRGATLDAQLTASTRSFLAAPGNLVLREVSGLLSGRRLEVSSTKILDWYEEDFEAWKRASPLSFANPNGQVAFLATWAPEEAATRMRAAGDAVVLAFQDYDWSLNQAP